MNIILLADEERLAWNTSRIYYLSSTSHNFYQKAISRFFPGRTLLFEPSSEQLLGGITCCVFDGDLAEIASRPTEQLLDS